MNKEAIQEVIALLDKADKQIEGLTPKKANALLICRCEDAVSALREALAEQQDIDWKDQYEKQKRRAEMWIAKYEADIGPLEKAGPVTAQQQEQDIAYMIAAAPELLEALKEIVDAADGAGWEQLDPSFKQARRAIAKATGEQT